jgi:anti-sigma factor RsiW
MSEERWNEKALESSAVAARRCARADELVTYLYGEAGEAEAKDFENHIGHCALCRTELSAFGQVRGSLGEWRKQSLGSLGSPAFEANAGRVLDTIRTTSERKRSAFAALREFFSLSPVWVRAGVVAASAAVCALAVMAVAHAEIRWDTNGVSFRTGLARERVVERTKTVEVEKPVKVGYSQEEVERIVADRISQERESFQNRGVPQPKIVPTGAPMRSNVVRNSTQPAKEVNQRNPPQQTLAQRDRQDEEDIPRLYDLLGDSN